MNSPGTTQREILGRNGVTTLVLSSLVVLVSVGLSLVPAASRVLRTARSAPTTAPTGSRIVVMGARLVNDQPTALFERRLQRALAHSQAGDTHRYLILGGITPGNRLSEADVGRDYLIRHGIDAARIDVEEHSRHTLENLEQARSMLADTGEPVTLVSCRIHLARSSVLANGFGMDCRLCGAEERFHYSLKNLWLLLREAYFLHWYHVGKIWSRLTRNRKSLARIS